MFQSNTVTAILALFSLALLGWQGGVLVRRGGYSTLFGILTLWLAVLCAPVEFYLQSGGLILSNELHVSMAQGSSPRIVLGFFLAGLSLAAGFGWFISLRGERRRELWGIAIFSVSIAVAVLAVRQIILLNPGDIKQIEVFSYDNLSPALLLWLVFCIAQSVAQKVPSLNRLEKTVAGTFVLYLVATSVLRIKTSFDPDSQGERDIPKICAAIACVLLAAWWLARKSVPLRHKAMRAVVFVLATVLFSALSAVASNFMNAMSILWYWALMLLLGALIYLGVWLFRMRKSPPPASASTAAESSTHGGDPPKHATIKQNLRLLTQRALAYFSSQREPLEQSFVDHFDRLRRNWILSVILASVFAVFFLTSYLATTDPSFRLIGLSLGPGIDPSVLFSGIIFVWVVMIEIFGLGPLTANDKGFIHGEATTSPLERFGHALWGRIDRWWRRGWINFIGFFRKAPARGHAADHAATVPPPSDDGTTSSGPSAASLAADALAKIPGAIKDSSRGWLWSTSKVLLVVVILIVVSELPNAHKTIVEPFETPASETVNKAVGQEVSDEIIANLGEMSNYFRYLVVGLKPGSGAGSQYFRPPSSMEGGAAGAIGTANDLSLPGGMKLPLNMLLLPIRGPTRWALGVRSISGSIHKTSKGYLLLATSSEGEPWSETSDAFIAPEPEPTSDAAIPELARKIAFGIATRDPSLASAGMGRRWEGYAPFKKGVIASYRFQAGHNYYDLADAIAAFREAVAADPDFALAYYRLGLALRDDGNPAGAVEALRKSINANPRFLPGYVALASTLQDFDDFKIGTAAITSRTPSPSRYYEEQARSIWTQVIAFPEGADLSSMTAAYSGLCNIALRAMDTDPRTTQLQYFYCKRAEQYFAKLPYELRNTPDNRQSEASALTYVGIALTRRQNRAVRTSDWLCSVYSVVLDVDDSNDDDQTQKDLADLRANGKVPEDNFVGPYAAAARQYFDLAHLLLPNDEYIRCNAALSAYALGDHQPMKKLEDTSSSRYALGLDFENKAKSSQIPEYYLLAMREFARAIARNPNSIWALNNYGYTYWQYRLATHGRAFPEWVHSDDWLGTDIAHDAEIFARRAYALSSSLDSQEDRIGVQGTLGELLLAQGRPEEAIGVLEPLLKQLDETPPNPLHPPAPQYDETRWDLSQAYICDSFHKGMDPGDQAKAAAVLAVILKNAVARNDDAWLGHPEFLTPQFMQQITCMNILYDKPFGGQFFIQKTGSPVYRDAQPCNATVVSAVIQFPIPQDTEYYIRVWGGDLSFKLAVGNSPEPGLLLTLEPRDTQNFYFAQLFTQPLAANNDDNGVPVSPVYPIHTYASSTDDCKRNDIQLIFVPPPAPIPPLPNPPQQAPPGKVP